MQSDNSGKDNDEIIDINSLEQNQDIMSQVYDQTYSLITSITIEVKDLQERQRVFDVITKIIKNIIDNPNEEKFKKLRLSNKNIEMIFKVDGVYDFFTYLGFREMYLDNEIYLVLIEYDTELLKLFYTNIQLLVCDNIDNSEEGNNTYTDPNFESKNEYLNDKNNLKTINDNFHLNSNLSVKKPKNIIDILKETKENRIVENTNLNTISNWNNYTSVNKSSSSNIKDILKETAGVRRNNSEYFSNDYNVVANNNFPEQKKDNNQNSRFVTLRDLEYSNPDNYYVNKSDFKVKDEIGKKCLELTNAFRARNGLRPVAWEDSVWKISYGHSQNMGNKKVKFGHDGFNDRIRKLPFYYSMACENVFMCHGYAEHSIAEMAVNGWINSPGHRKNLLSNTSHCAIAIYKNGNGEWYLTQIFVRK
jgi:uncharacterized protein YkwD